MKYEGKNEFWVVKTDNGIAHADEELGIKKFWNSGSPSLVFIPIFSNRKSAMKFRKFARKHKTVRWASTKRCKIIQE